MKGVLDSIELQMLRRVDYVRQCNFLRETHVQSRVEHIQHLILGRVWVGRLYEMFKATDKWNVYNTHI